MKKFFTLIAVAAMAFAAQAVELTVAEGDAECEYAPIYGLYMDTQGTTSQMIYPSSMLEDMKDGKITALKFYATQPITGLGTGNLQLSLLEVEQDGFTSTTMVTGATAVANGYPVQGETELVFTFDQPFEYKGGNLMIETVLTTAGTFKSTRFVGQATPNTTALVQYGYSWSTSFYYYAESKLPKATFTYEEAAPIVYDETCLAPNSAYAITGTETATITITNREDGATVYYEVYCNDVLVDEGNFTGASFSFDVTGDGAYVVLAVAKLQGKNDSPDGGVFFTISEGEEPPVTGIDELVNGKQVAGVRYFNVAGQEMPEANGMTIVVTTYTDGTTSTAKVVK